VGNERRVRLLQDGWLRRGTRHPRPSAGPEHGPAADPSRFGEIQTYVGQTNADDNAAFSLTANTPIRGGQVVTATMKPTSGLEPTPSNPYECVRQQVVLRVFSIISDPALSSGFPLVPVGLQ
jgi:hypothetical protein